jgi:hypothetical protein
MESWNGRRAPDRAYFCMPVSTQADLILNDFVVVNLLHNNSERTVEALRLRDYISQAIIKL